MTELSYQETLMPPPTSGMAWGARAAGLVTPPHATVTPTTKVWHTTS